MDKENNPNFGSSLKEIAQSVIDFRDKLNSMLAPYAEDIQKFALAFQADKKFRAEIESLGGKAFLFRNLNVGPYVDAPEHAQKTMYSYVETDEFSDNIKKILQEIPTLTHRWDRINAGLTLHKTGNYHESCTLISAQLEGLLTDCLEELGIVMREGKKLCGMTPCGDYKRTPTKKQKDTLTGISKKLDYAKDYVKIGDFFDELDSELFGNTHKINDFRNLLMHGESTIAPTQEDSVKLLYWLSGLLARIYVLLNDDLTLDEVRNKQLGIV